MGWINPGFDEEISEEGSQSRKVLRGSLREDLRERRERRGRVVAESARGSLRRKKKRENVIVGENWSFMVLKSWLRMGKVGCVVIQKRGKFKAWWDFDV